MGYFKQEGGPNKSILILRLVSGKWNSWKINVSTTTLDFVQHFRGTSEEIKH